MGKLFTIAQIIVAVTLSAAILLQNRGSGLSSVFGGGGEVYRTKRGAERVLFIVTIVLAVLFLGLGLVRVIIP